MWRYKKNQYILLKCSTKLWLKMQSYSFKFNYLEFLAAHMEVQLFLIGILT